MLSPYLYNVYIDKLTAKLNKNYTGCNIGGFLINHIKYVDDVCLIASSPVGLRVLVKICEKVVGEFDVLFNLLKIQCMVFNKQVYISSSKLYMLGYMVHASSMFACWNLGVSLLRQI